MTKPNSLHADAASMALTDGASLETSTLSTLGCVASVSTDFDAPHPEKG